MLEADRAAGEWWHLVVERGKDSLGVYLQCCKEGFCPDRDNVAFAFTLQSSKDPSKSVTKGEKSANCSFGCLPELRM